MSLLTHIERKVREHAKRFAVLPTVTVPSAAVTDDDTEAWGDIAYLRLLLDDILTHRELRLSDALDGVHDSEIRGVQAIHARDEALLDFTDRAAEQLAVWRAELDGVTA